MSHEIKEIMPGVYQIIPCACNQCMQDRQAILQKQREIFRRIDEAYESVFGKECENKNGAVLSAT